MAMVCAISVDRNFTHMSQGTSVAVACPPTCGQGACVSQWSRLRGFSWDETGRVVPATSTTETAALECSWAGVMPRIMSSDLLALSCKPFRRNQVRTAVVHWLRHWRAAVVSDVLSPMTSCMSSVNLWYTTPCELMRSPTGDMYAVKSRGPRTDPRRTTALHIKCRLAPGGWHYQNSKVHETSRATNTEAHYSSTAV